MVEGIDPKKRVICGEPPPEWGGRRENLPRPETWSGKIEFLEDELCRDLPRIREARRFDFREEWNNLGYGAIPISDPEFGICTAYFPETSVRVIALVEDADSWSGVPYMAIRDDKDSATLWINRRAGAIDGFDQHIVERFLADYRWRDLGATPVLTEVPVGFEAAVTMRIDCDEAVASGRALFELYRARGVPFSLAVKTQQALGLPDFELMRDVLAAGGSVVSHSHTHAPNWGGSREAARWEVEESHRQMKSWGIDGLNFQYAVSPFHQNPLPAAQGLADAGLRGFIGGIICNDPGMLFEKAQRIPGDERLFTHSQQCMFHGETYDQQDRRLHVYEQAFRTAKTTGRLFGYLDHPFSQYWYDWESEELRIKAHADFLDFLDGFSGVWKASLADAMRFLDDKVHFNWRQEPSGRWILERTTPMLQERLPWVRFQGRWVDAGEFLS